MRTTMIVDGLGDGRRRPCALAVASALLLSVAGCSSSSAPTLDATWQYNNGTEGNGLTFRSDGTYTAEILVLTSSDSGNAEVETGTFVTSGTTIDFIPARSSCPGADPPYSGSYALENGDLQVTFPTISRVYTLDTSAVSTFSLTIGCFDTAGAFAVSPLENVSP